MQATRANIKAGHVINTENAPPQNSALRIYSLEKRHIIADEVDKMLKNGQIRPSQSSWSSLVVLVKKKDGTLNSIVDNQYRIVVTRKDEYPIPNMEHTINRLGGNAWYSKLDLKSGYHQIPIREQDKFKKAFKTPKGLFEFNVLPQGLKNAPPTFQRIMDQLLANTRWDYCLVYLDDIIIFSKSFKEHLIHLEDVLATLTKANFQLNPAKCQLFKPEIEYLGHIVNGYGIKPSQRNIEALAVLPVPISTKQVHSFIYERKI
ncbi:unnamed protein product [Didymodactylos carnosus]|uniref:Reverse transcriptase domain-containing protein n=1 Tax=Didymodactylos carnosus TaxID=1234261 RepID=A0A813VFY9_9BILA|nr:unnamed protein product [Didymodactylos carnosus]CAF1081761.1 unnamed protein product [Didymodactylos carnosus]CAF3627650.1 unnamed protein product [Didymodactylos carnosus]CAF3844635.1 unnamed protein product [Didymodactylos carnosus]